MKLSTLICASIMLLATEKISAQDDWNHIGEGVVSNDTTVKKGFTLIFINKSPTFSPAVKQRMIDAFYTVYPKEAKTYNKKTLKKVIFLVDPQYKGVAATAGNIVRYNPSWFVSHPEDIDVVTHEVMHIVQGYGDNAGPGWLTEGIADYVRFKFGVDNEGAKWTMPAYNAKQSYTNAYRVTARFLVWTEKNYDKKLVKKMDAALRSHTYNADLWKQYTGKTVDELWSDYGKNPVI
jgi:hypothetical protein